MIASHLLPCLLAFATCAEVCAQQTVVPAGGVATGAGGSVCWTLGQVDYTANGSASGTVAQGVQQPIEFLILATAEEDPVTRSISAMPDTASDGITVQLGGTSQGTTTYRVVDLTGQEVANGRFTGASAYIPFSALAASTYFIHVLYGGSDTSVLRVIKHWTMEHFLLATSLFLNLQALAQAPERMSFQAMVRDDANTLVTNSTVGMRLSVLQGSASGTAVSVETHSTTTNPNGSATVLVRGGTVVNGTMADVDRGTGPYFLKTETDPDGGGNFSVTGTSQLLSVPYALYAANSEPGPAGPPGMPGVGGCDPNNRDSLIVLFNTTLAHGFYQDPFGVGHWSAHTLGGTNHIGAKRCTLMYNSANAHVLHLDNTGI